MTRLRGHHALCILSFEGKGYSSTFVENMKRIIQNLETIEFVDGCDEICKACPHNKNGQCISSKVARYDKMLREKFPLKQYIWNEIKGKLRNLDLSEICSDCQWYSICKKRLG